MEELLRKMARQLDSLDEASLSALWDRYAAIVSRFEPTKRWEEAALVFSFIQAKRWKNQLFNSSLALRAKPDESVPPPSAPPRASVLTREEPRLEARPRAKILPFRPRKKPPQGAPDEKK